MKSFDELTIDQKMVAYTFAHTTLVESLKDGFVEFSKSLSEQEIKDLAEEIAEEATYDNDGKPYVEGMDIPYHFLGGCV